MTGVPAIARALLLLCLVASACQKKPTRDECEQMIDHLLDLQLAKAPPEGKQKAVAMVEAMREEMVTECLEEATQERVQCFLAATAEDEIRKCYKK